MGKKAEIVKRFLYILSYFIRCSEVHENSDLQCLNNIVNDTQFELSLSPTLSEKTLIDGLERSTSPANGSVFTRQISAGGGLPGLKTSGTDTYWGHTRSKLEAPVEEDSIEHLTKTRSEPVICSVSDTNKHDTSYCLERSDSGYNGANFESSCEQDPGEVQTICADKTDLVGKTALEFIKSGRSNYVPSVKSNTFCETKYHLHMNPVYSDSILSSDSCHMNKSRDLMDCELSPVMSQIQVVSSSSVAGEATGMSDLYIYDPESFPVSCVTTSKVIESPNVERVVLAGRATANANHNTADFAKVSDEPVSRSQSFSEGKVKSRLTQQLDEGVDDVCDADFKIITSSAGSGSSWLSNESKKETDSSKSPISRQTSLDSKMQPGRPTTLTKSR